MNALLEIKGPIVTPQVVKSNCTFLHMMTTGQFMNAAQELHDLGLGTLISVKTAGQPSKVFVKNAPEVVQVILKANPDLCNGEYYAVRYHQPVSKSINLGVRFRVAQMGLLPKKILMQ